MFKLMCISLNSIFLIILLCKPSSMSIQSSVPADFVFIDDIIPTIKQNLRYNTNENFMGHPLPGYSPNASAMLTENAAEALSKVQQTLSASGYSLLIYDAYRPQRTVDYFFEWFKNSSDQSKKTYYYPNQDLKKPEIRDKYFTPTSGHSRGSTLDLTIIKLGKDVKEVNPVEQTLSDGRKILRLDDGSLDVGGSFDLFDDSSYHNTTLITDQQKEMRAYLKKVMDQHGFDAFVPEWWHYNLRDEPYPKTFFDFDVMSKGMLYSGSNSVNLTSLTILLIMLVVVVTNF